MPLCTGSSKGKRINISCQNQRHWGIMGKVIHHKRNPYCKILAIAEQGSKWYIHIHAFVRGKRKLLLWIKQSLRKQNSNFSSLSFLTDAAGNERYLSLSKTVVSFPSSLGFLSPGFPSHFRVFFFKTQCYWRSTSWISMCRKGSGFFLQVGWHHLKARLLTSRETLSLQEQNCKGVLTKQLHFRGEVVNKQLSYQLNTTLLSGWASSRCSVYSVQTVCTVPNLTTKK